MATAKFPVRWIQMQSPHCARRLKRLSLVNRNSMGSRARLPKAGQPLMKTGRHPWDLTMLHLPQTIEDTGVHEPRNNVLEYVSIIMPNHSQVSCSLNVIVSLTLVSPLPLSKISTFFSPRKNNESWKCGFRESSRQR